MRKHHVENTFTRRAVTHIGKFETGRFARRFVIEAAAQHKGRWTTDALRKGGRTIKFVCWPFSVLQQNLDFLSWSVVWFWKTTRLILHRIEKTSLCQGNVTQFLRLPSWVFRIVSGPLVRGRAIATSKTGKFATSVHQNRFALRI